MAAVNKVILLGNLGKDPELKYTASGLPVATFSLATTEKRTDKNGQKKETTEWHNIVFYGKPAELAKQYLSKGRSVYLEGRIATRSWDDKDGVKKYKTEIIGSTMQFLSSGQGGGNAPSAGTSPNSIDPSFAPEPDFDQGPAPEPVTGSNDDLPF